jgi:hypothetical protein
MRRGMSFCCAVPPVHLRGVGAQLARLGGAPQLLHGTRLDLAGPLAADVEARADLVERTQPRWRRLRLYWELTSIIT